MIARIRATGEIAEFSTGKNLQGETILLKVGTASIFSLDEVELIADTDWNQVRIQAAIAAMQTVDDHVSTVEELAARCVRYADALVAELQKKGGNNEQSRHKNDH